jgi:16S rRNA (guanine966-N2)-methyltransferase
VRGRLKGPFDLIFADPPYRIDIKYLHGIFLTIQGNGLLEADGMLILEGPARREPIALERDFTLLKRRVYGDTCMEFYELGPSEGTEGERPSEK